MNEQPKSKMLVIIIGILLLANVIMLSFLLMNDSRDSKKAKRSYVSEYLEKEVGLDASQLIRYDSLSRHHREEIKAAYKSIAANRKNIFSTLAASSFSDSAIATAAGAIHEQQRIFEVNMLRHLKDIRDICTDSQRRRFDTGFYKIVGRWGDPHKEK